MIMLPDGLALLPARRFAGQRWSCLISYLHNCQSNVVSLIEFLFETLEAGLIKGMLIPNYTPIAMAA